MRGEHAAQHFARDTQRQFARSRVEVEELMARRIIFNFSLLPIAITLPLSLCLVCNQARGIRRLKRRKKEARGNTVVVEKRAERESPHLPAKSLAMILRHWTSARERAPGQF